MQVRGWLLCLCLSALSVSSQPEQLDLLVAIPYEYSNTQPTFISGWAVVTGSPLHPLNHQYSQWTTTQGVGDSSSSFPAVNFGAPSEMRSMRRCRRVQPLPNSALLAGEYRGQHGMDEWRIPNHGPYSPFLHSLSTTVSFEQHTAWHLHAVKVEVRLRRNLSRMATSALLYMHLRSN